eukprot:COSAG01_NODE_4202_length_5244_cov_168.024101_4_plen_132_part_00
MPHNKAHCAKASKALRRGSSKGGRVLAQCRWGKKKKAMAKPAAAPARRSRRLAGKAPVRAAAPKPKPRKRAPPGRRAKPSAAMTRMSNIISPGVVETKRTKNMFNGRQYKTAREAEAARWNAGYGSTQYRA